MAPARRRPQPSASLCKTHPCTPHWRRHRPHATRPTAAGVAMAPAPHGVFLCPAHPLTSPPAHLPTRSLARSLRRTFSVRASPRASHDHDHDHDDTPAQSTTLDKSVARQRTACVFLRRSPCSRLALHSSIHPLIHPLKQLARQLVCIPSPSPTRHIPEPTSPTNR